VPDPEKVPPPANTTTIEDEPVDVDPEAPVDDAGDAQEKRRKIKLFIIHTRLARFFAWILLLSFVILPGTFKGDSSDSVKNSPLYVPAFSPLVFSRLFLMMSSCPPHPPHNV
jgi:hypothetical protein